jgi:hypothetical protein
MKCPYCYVDLAWSDLSAERRSGKSVYLCKKCGREVMQKSTAKPAPVPKRARKKFGA